MLNNVRPEECRLQPPRQVTSSSSTISVTWATRELYECDLDQPRRGNKNLCIAVCFQDAMLCESNEWSVSLPEGCMKSVSRRGHNAVQWDSSSNGRWCNLIGLSEATQMLVHLGCGIGACSCVVRLRRCRTMAPVLVKNEYRGDEMKNSGEAQAQTTRLWRLLPQ